MFFNNRLDMIYAPVSGEVVPLTKVPDKMFADKLLGDGVALLYETDVFCSPCYGKVIMISPTKHAVGIEMKNGAEILIHIGLDTYEMNGQGLQTLVKLHQRVKPGQALIKLNREELSNFNLITPMIVTNTRDYNFNSDIEKKIQRKEQLFLIKKKQTR